MRSSNTSAASFLLASFSCLAVARADIIVGDFSSLTASPSTSQRFRESDAGLVCTAVNNGETMQGIALGSDGILYSCYNTVGFGSIGRHNALTGAALPALVPGGGNGYEIPNGLAIIGNSIYSTSQLFNGGGVSGVVRFDVTNGAFLGTPVLPGDHGLGQPQNVYRAPNNDLLVTDGSRINRYDPSGTFINTFIANASGFGQSTFGPDGNFYVRTSAGVDRYDGTMGTFLGNFNDAKPRSITFGNDGNLYALFFTAGAAQGNILRYDGTSGAFIDTFRSVPGGDLIPNYLLTGPNTPEPTAAAAAGMLVATASLRRRRGARVD